MAENIRTTAESREWGTENRELRTDNSATELGMAVHHSRFSVLGSRFPIFSLLFLPVCSLAHAQEARDAAWIDRRIEAWQPTKDERRFDDIAWAADLRTAMKLAKQHHRPVFLFTHDGHMAIGRC